VTNDLQSIERLAELSRSAHLHASLAAERSLEDFTGEKADQALVSCVLGWQYDAYVRACQTLLDRNKPLLVKTLLEATPPKKCRYYQGIFLARCDQPEAVPILCEEVPGRAIIDREMFEHIARLGQDEHRDMILALPGRVRQEQQRLAADTVRKYTTKVE
jgi:hypothetical protein